MAHSRALLTNKVALITGASSGIGAATAILFSSLGAKVAMVGRNADKLKDVKRQCVKDSDSSDKILPVIVDDMKNESAVEHVLKSTVDHFGQLDILVNNAGIMTGGGIENTSLERLDELYNVNVRSVFHLTMLAVPHLIKTKGNIVNVSSITGLRAFPGLISYCMSKAAVDQFTKCVALDLAPKGVRCNSVNPGVIVTDLQRRGLELSDDQFADFLNRSAKVHPLGRPGVVHEVADAIAFLASDQSSFVTGINMSIDGGRAAACPASVE